MQSVKAVNFIVPVYCYVLERCRCKLAAYPQRHTTMQCNIIAFATVDTERDVLCGYEIVDYRPLLESGVGHVEGQSVVGASAVLCQRSRVFGVYWTVVR
jgi:hypothetical protein